MEQINSEYEAWPIDTGQRKENTAGEVAISTICTLHPENDGLVRAVTVHSHGPETSGNVEPKSKFPVSLSCPPREALPSKNILHYTWH